MFRHRVETREWFRFAQSSSKQDPFNSPRAVAATNYSYVPVNAIGDPNAPHCRDDTAGASEQRMPPPCSRNRWCSMQMLGAADTATRMIADAARNKSKKS
jgi:hypothetical protein